MADPSRYPDDEVVQPEPDEVAEPLDPLADGVAPAKASGLVMELAQAEEIMAQFRLRQNFAAAVLAGSSAALAGALAWAGIVYATGWKIGPLGLGVGLLAGLAVRSAGKGIEPRFGALGAGLAAAGCLMGNLFAVCMLAAHLWCVGWLEVLSVLTPGSIAQLLVETFSLVDIGFYAGAIAVGFSVSYSEVSRSDVISFLHRRAAGSRSEA